MAGEFASDSLIHLLHLCFTEQGILACTFTIKTEIYENYGLTASLEGLRLCLSLYMTLEELLTGGAAPRRAQG